MEDFNLWAFILENLEAAGVIGGYVSISIIGVALITFATRKRIEESNQIGPQWAQPMIGALLGVIPGCGGTIVASSMYKNNKLSFGGLFAAFVTTLGEGSFVLLGASKEADVAANLTAFAIINAVGFAVGVILGYVVDGFGWQPSKKFLSSKDSSDHNHDIEPSGLAHNFIEHIGFYTILAIALFLAPGSIMALWGSEISAIADLSVWVAIAFTVISIIYFLTNKFLLGGHCHNENLEDLRSVLLEAVLDITMVISYVFVGLFVFNFIIDVLVGPETFDAWMTTSSLAVVIISAIIGATPGCGGMIAVAVAFTTIANFPMAALIAAAIATSGDGIFPLLAENKKDALIITLAGLGLALVVGCVALALGI